MCSIKILYLFALVIFYTGISVSDGYAYITNISTHPDFPDKCYWAEEKAAFAQGFVYRPPDKCELIECTTGYRISVVGCGVMAALPGCKEIVQNLSMPFPNCCHRYECNNDKHAPR